MGKDEVVKREEPGPDEGIRRSLTAPDDEDTEGHKKFVRDAGPDEGWKLPATPDDEADTEGHKRDADDPLHAADDGKGDEPGPNDSRFSDRNLKVGIVPVEW